ncbi:MAG: hypothetical protein V7K53_06130 [Nostoc sp.]|uniref:hypothetical protein n=1 Tax=Nostoc sp. TaxID=1180 RepID=UPI002FFA9FAA
MALQVDAIIICATFFYDDSSRSVRHRYLQKAIPQVDNTTNGTGYPFENRYKMSKRVFYV